MYFTGAVISLVGVGTRRTPAPTILTLSPPPRTLTVGTTTHHHHRDPQKTYPYTTFQSCPTPLSLEP